MIPVLYCHTRSFIVVAAIFFVFLISALRLIMSIVFDFAQSTRGSPVRRDELLRGSRGRLRACIVVTAVGSGLWCTGVTAQELAPRAYWPAPKGTNLIVAGYEYSSGDVVTDPTLPLENVDSEASFAQVSYQRTLSLFKRTTNVQINQPYVWSSTKGLVEGEFRTRDISAFADTRMLVSVNLLGAPTMDAAEFQALRAKPRTIVGGSVLVTLPTGEYDSDKLINAGSNRWAVKLATGMILPLRPRWLLEVDLGLWLFGDNDDYLGTTRQQDPIYSAEFHLVKRIRPGLWTSLDFNVFGGGQTTVGGETRDDKQGNSRLGATVVIPFKRHHAIRSSYSTAIVTRAGGDYDSLSASYIYVW